jgi:hypothetical protein
MFPFDNYVCNFSPETIHPDSNLHIMFNTLGLDSFLPFPS